MPRRLGAVMKPFSTFGIATHRSSSRPMFSAQVPFGIEANRVGLAHFFGRLANARIARQSLAAIGRAFKGRDGDRHREALSQNHSPWGPRINQS
jgi:hypothetical protein